MNWDRAAPWYDLQLRLERPALRAAVELASIRSSDTLIDVGCGTGAFLRELAQNLPDHRPVRAVGLDASAAMLMRCSRHLPGGWSLVPGDAARIPFPDASFDVAVCTYVLHILHARMRVATVIELHRIVRPGGRVVMVTPLPPGCEPASTRARFAAALSRSAPSCFESLRPLDPTTALEQAGFTVTEARPVVRGYPSLCVLATRR